MQKSLNTDWNLTKLIGQVNHKLNMLKQNQQSKTCIPSRKSLPSYLQVVIYFSQLVKILELVCGMTFNQTFYTCLQFLLSKSFTSLIYGLRQEAGKPGEKPRWQGEHAVVRREGPRPKIKTTTLLLWCGSINCCRLSLILPFSWQSSLWIPQTWHIVFPYFFPGLYRPKCTFLSTSSSAFLNMVTFLWMWSFSLTSFFFFF